MAKPGVLLSLLSPLSWSWPNRNEVDVKFPAVFLYITHHHLEPCTELAHWLH